MKTCPYCAEEIQDAAIKCRYCKSMLEDFTPAEPEPEPEPEPVKKTSILHRTFSLSSFVLVLVIGFVMLSTPEDKGGANQKQQISESENKVDRLAMLVEYEMIEEGMSRGEVAEIVGSTGNYVDISRDPLFDGDEGTYTTYKYEGLGTDTATMVCVFRDEILHSKHQVGLANFKLSFDPVDAASRAHELAESAGHLPVVNVSTDDIVAALVRAQTAPVTLSRYSTIKEGWNYSDVASAIGGDGEELLNTSAGGVAINVYLWRGVGSPGANMTAFFANGKLYQKSQIGLE